MSKDLSPPKFFNTLDILRGFAAMAVVFHHWQHFFLDGLEVPDFKIFDKTTQPLYSIFFLLYQAGDTAVDLFFALSGFIFFWIYQEKITSGVVSFREFALLRFSRLYPLHFITLILVLLLQLIHLSIKNEFYVYPFNDLYHFFLNLLFISQWGFEKGFSYNGPIWSVSVEIFLYLAFFFISKVRLVKNYHIVLFIILGFCFIKFGISPFGRGIFAFYIGALIYRIYLNYNSKIIKSNLTWIICSFTVILWLFVLLESGDFIDLSHVLKSISSISRIPDNWIIKIFVVAILFPLTIFSLVLLETKNHTLGKRLSFIGRLTYSSYLLHFPLQLIFKIVVSYFGWELSILMTPAALGLFFLFLIPLSLITYQTIEMPLQSRLRKLLLGRKNAKKLKLS